QEKMYTLEYNIYYALIESTEAFVPHIQENAKILAQIDCYVSFATQAKKHDYAQPKMNANDVIDIQASRHPVIEQYLPIAKKYIPNDVYLDLATQQILLITGPNMAGKSAFLRQVALAVLMAQIGSFVPAQKATIGIVDKIFTRVGAHDNLAMGESTFMVEMQEMASILHNLSNKSLVIVDELGRGTSTSDGLSLAQATLEYLHHTARHKPKTLFATHYHELSELETYLSRIKNFHVAVKQIQGEVLFLHQLKKGASPNSFGIQVAKMAGMPHSLIGRAQAILAKLASHEQTDKIVIEAPLLPTPIHEKNREIDVLKKALDQIDVNSLSPVEALLKLEELKFYATKATK
ncbi:MAG: DNA mismatch repair protein MutS, partial [Bacteroidota bacterium]